MNPDFSSSIFKKCTQCGHTKPLSEFPKDRQKKDGVYSSCKQCANRRTSQWGKANRTKTNRASRDWKARHPRRVKAQGIAWRAILVGVLVREPCEVCGTTHDVNAHHDDYAKPLEVRWLCRPHHAVWHAANGEGRNG